MVLLALASAWARPQAPALFCELYDEAPSCVSGSTSCTTCHSLNGAPAHNPYGADLLDELDPQDFEGSLHEALSAIEELDSDGDGRSNLDEILIGSEPGFESSIEPECSAQNGTDNDWYRVGEYDHAFAYKRVMLDFCGRSPRYDEVQAFAGRGDQDEVLQETLGLCLQSPYWDEVLEELATQVVQPVGPPTDINILGNWEWDLRLWAYAMSGDRDAAEVLTATYYVIEDPAGSGILAPIYEPRDEAELYAQPLEREHRYGLMTTRYALAMRVMFSRVPRTLTAHAYRQILGLDMSRNEGLYPVDELDGEYDWPAPRDVDDKGVWQEACAGCHTTLDPMSYPWVRYNGIDLDGDTTGVWLEDRVTEELPSIEGWLLGEPVEDPRDWVEVAVASDAFAQRTTEIFWTYLMRRAPYSCEDEEFQALWTDFRDNGRNVEDMLALLVASEAYGVP
jgi:hypothetical protein